MAALAQKEIEHLMAQGYQEHEAREVALPQFILQRPGPADEADDDPEIAADLREIMQNLVETARAIVGPDPE